MCVCMCVCVCAFLLKGWFAVSRSLLLSPSLQVEKREDESSLMQLKEEVKSVGVCVCVGGWVHFYSRSDIQVYSEFECVCWDVCVGVFMNGFL